MRDQRGFGAFPSIFLTFSLLLLVLAAGFAVGRLWVARVYMKGAPGMKGVVGASAQSAAQGRSSYAGASGQLNIPSPAQSKSESAPEENQNRTLEQEEPQEQETIIYSEPPAEKPAETEESPSFMPTPEPTDSGEKRFSLQIGVFSSRSAANKVVDALTRAGYAARVEAKQQDAQNLYRVLTGRYRSEYAARKAMDQIKQEGFSAYLVEE